VGTIILHVGMPKTGSTSIQTWIQRAAPVLRDAHGIQVMHDTLSRDAGASMVPYEGTGGVATIGFLLRLQAALNTDATPATLHEITDQFALSLDAAAHAHGTVLATSEGLSTPIIRGVEPFLDSLGSLTSSHSVRIVCYVRPQHTAIVSRWRQWGWLEDLPPGEWVEAQADDLAYRDWLNRARAAMPAVTWDIRPYRKDLLTGGDVVIDFAGAVVGSPVAAAGSDTVPEDNAGLPLDLVIALRGAPKSLTQTPGAELPGRMESGLRQRNLGTIVQNWQLPESDAARRSLEVVHAHSWQRFEASNQELIDEFGWNATAFIDEPTDASDALSELDELWQPTPSAADPYLYAALTQLCETLENDSPTSG